MLIESPHVYITETNDILIPALTIAPLPCQTAADSLYASNLNHLLQLLPNLQITSEITPALFSPSSDYDEITPALIDNGDEWHRRGGHLSRAAQEPS